MGAPSGVYSVGLLGWSKKRPSDIGGVAETRTISWIRNIPRVFRGIAWSYVSLNIYPLTLPPLPPFLQLNPVYACCGIVVIWKFRFSTYCCISFIFSRFPVYIIFLIFSGTLRLWPRGRRGRGRPTSGRTRSSALATARLTSTGSKPQTVFFICRRGRATVSSWF